MAAAERMPDLAELVTDVSGAKHFMSRIMDTTVRIQISDGRFITGQLWCFDQLKNAILLHCQETRISSENGKEEEHHRPLGPLVMVPGKHIVRIEAIRAHVDTAAQEAAIVSAAMRAELRGQPGKESS